MPIKFFFKCSIIAFIFAISLTGPPGCREMKSKVLSDGALRSGTPHGAFSSPWPLGAGVPLGTISSFPTSKALDWWK